MDKQENGYVFVTEEGFYTSVWEVLFSDMLKQDNVLQVTEPNDTRPLAFWLKKNKIQALTRGKLNFYLEKNYLLYAALEKMTCNYKSVWIVFLNASFTSSRFPARLLLDYKKRWPNIHYALFYVDCVERPFNYHANGLWKRGDIFELIYTFDAKDAMQYKFRHWNTVYSKLDIKNTPEIDLFFCGLPTSRQEIIQKILDECPVHNIKLQMNLVCDGDDYNHFSQYPSSVQLGRAGVDFWPYPKTLEATMRSRCILDITQGGQAGLTLRSYEAVCYNRKLLTNNKSILDFEFYDPRFMQYFEKVEDVDWDWVKEDVEVDYHYNGEFSPIHLLEDIEQQMKET